MRLTQVGQIKSVMARILGMREQTLGDWFGLAAKRTLAGARAKPVNTEQIELVHVRFEPAPAEMERDP